MIWRCGTHCFTLGDRTLVMGVLNLTPDSFSDGGQFADPQAAVEHALQMAEAGADIIDIGGESSRPGSASVSAAEEIRRVLPIIGRLAEQQPTLCLSLDTTKAEVAQAGLEAGASIVNDISGLESDPAMLPTLAAAEAGCVIMHMRGTPRTMQDNPQYRDVVEEVGDYLEQRTAAAEAAGIARERICLDPGIGFGKTVEHNLELLGRLDEFARLERPLLIGPSRKAFIGATLNLAVGERLEGTLAACVAAVLHGAAIVRVHDVKEVRRAVDLADAIRGQMRQDRQPRA
jgi:dihydropteroate synthase